VSIDVGDTVEGESQVQYPIYVDPDWSSGQTASWYTDAAYPSQSYLTSGSSDVLRVGISAPYKGDLFYQFPMTALAGKKVIKATLNTTQIAALSCPATAIDLYTFGPKTAGFTYNQQHSWTGVWGPLQQSQNPGDCHSGSMAVGWNVTSGVTSYAGKSLVQFMITYHDVNSQLSRRHYSRSAKLVVTYNTTPAAPTSPKIANPPRSCGTASAPAFIGSTSITMQVNQTDADGGNVGTDFFIAKASDLNTVVKTDHSGLVAQGTRKVEISGLTNGTAYAWRARGYDTVVNNGGYSAWCYFTVDTTKPAVPGTSSAATSFTVGSPVTVNLTGTSDTAGYVYWVTPQQLVSPAPIVPTSGTTKTTEALPDCSKLTSDVRYRCASGTTAVPITVAPTDAFSTLWVSAYDKAGNQSLAKGFPLYAGTDPAATNAGVDQGHEWQVTGLTSPLPTSIADANPHLGAAAIALSAPATWGTATDVVVAPAPSPVLQTQSANDTDKIATAAAPVDASKSFSISMWVKPTATADTVIASQAGPGRGSMQLKIAGGKWSFCLTGAPASDDGGRPVSGCATGGTVTANAWKLVTGIWDASNQQLRVLVGGSAVPVAQAAHVLGSGDWSAAGPLTIGAGPKAQRFAGMIANPTVVPAVIGSTQLAKLAGLYLPFSD